MKPDVSEPEAEEEISRLLHAFRIPTKTRRIPMKQFLLLTCVVGLSLTPLSLAQDAKNPHVVMETSLGKITVELYADKAPITVKNFLQYVDDKHYDGTIFHRVIENFMIQGGGFQPGLREKKTRDAIKNEADNGLKNERGTIAMARTSEPHSATAQFFINLKDNGFLNHRNKDDGWGYCVFGKVVAGMDVVDKIKAVRTGNAGGHQNVPVEDVVIKSVRREQKRTLQAACGFAKKPHPPAPSPKRRGGERHLLLPLSASGRGPGGGVFDILRAAPFSEDASCRTPRS